MKTIILADPRGFCAGVKRAIMTVETALEKYGAPIYVRHNIVHNEFVVKGLEKNGVIFVEDIKNIPRDAIVIFSAHGIAPEIKEEATQLGLKTIDATCPFVTKVHLEVLRYTQEGRKVILIGHKNHQEAISIMGEAPIIVIENIDEARTFEPQAGEKYACLTQTTLSFDETMDIIELLKNKIPDLALPPKSDICSATQSRQNVIKEIAREVDLVLVVGSKTSSNSNRLADIAGKFTNSHLIADKSEINEEWIANAEKIGITSGASTPENLVSEIIDYITEKYPETKIEILKREKETDEFSLPIELSK